MSPEKKETEQDELEPAAKWGVRFTDDVRKMLHEMDNLLGEKRPDSSGKPPSGRSYGERKADTAVSPEAGLATTSKAAVVGPGPAAGGPEESVPTTPETPAVPGPTGEEPENDVPVVPEPDAVGPGSSESTKDEDGRVEPEAAPIEDLAVETETESGPVLPETGAVGAGPKEEAPADGTPFQLAATPPGQIPLDEDFIRMDAEEVETQGNVNGKGLVNAPAFGTDKGLMDGRGLVNGNGLVNGKGLRSETGLVNGHGLGNDKGLVNGNGLVNGKGLVNGHGVAKGGLINGRGFMTEKGLVNGNGLVNGRGETDTPVRPSGKRNAKSRSRSRLLALVAVAAALLLLLSIFAISRSPPSGRLSVDGNFSDWNGRAFYEDERTPALPAGLDLLSYSVATQDGRMFFCVRTAGNILSGKTAEKGVDTFDILIDTDGNQNTGYRIAGLGVDRRVEVYGWDGIVRGSGVYSFSEGRGQQDWNGWAANGAAEAAASGKSLEASVGSSNLGLSRAGDYRVYFRVRDSNGLGDAGKALVGPSPGSLTVTQKSAALPVLPAGSVGAPVLSLRMDAQVRDVHVGGLTLTKNGDAGPSDYGNMTLKIDQLRLASGTFTLGSDRLALNFDLNLIRGESTNVTVCVDITSNATPGASFGLRVAGEGDIDAETGAVSFIGVAPSSCYLISRPAHIKIDGAFADWDRTVLQNDTMGDGAGPNTDLTAYQGVKSNGTVAFYAAVDGTMMGGVLSPGTRERPIASPAGPSHGPGPVVVLPELNGSDTVKVYIDSDHNYLTGANVGPALFGADMALVVSGIEGRILSKEVLHWVPAQGWEHKGTLEAACDETRLELAAPLTLLGLDENSSFGAYIVASDWRGTKDLSQQRMDFVDPLELTSDSTVYSSSDGSIWDEHDTLMSNPVDMCTDNITGYAYILTTEGDVWETIGGLDTWSEIIETDSDKSFVAIASDSDSVTPYLYSICTDGQAYYTSVSDKSWNAGGTVGDTSDYVDLCYASGSGTGATLYAISKDTGNTAFISTDGGANWNSFGSKTVGDNGTATNNIGIIYGSNVWSDGDSYLFILQNDGNIQYHNTGNTGDDWASINTNGTTIPGGVLTDFDFNTGGTSPVIWVMDDSGNTYTVTPESDTVGYGDWSDKLGTSASNTVAVSGNEKLELTSDSTLYSTHDGITWVEHDINPSYPVDLCTDHTTGYAYMLTKNGDVWESTGDWDKWSQIIETDSDNTFVAIDTDSDLTTPYLYCMVIGGEVYHTKISDASWTDVGNVSAGVGVDMADLGYASGSGTGATLFAVAVNTNVKVHQSTDGGQNWGKFGNRDVGNDGNSETNIGIIYVSSVWSGSYLFILQSDGDIRYDTDGKTSHPWPALTTPASGTYTDLDWDVTNLKIWMVDDSGNTYAFTPSGSAGGGSWSAKLGTSAANTVAIAVNEEIPEFQDVALPIIGLVAFFIVFRRVRVLNAK